MSSVRIALQPPPNVDFVVGYPGIPPGARDRPQAAVKGAVEVRVGPAGARAKWVRVELKKIETLPGGGQANSFYDHVGPSPISLWQSSEDYSVLQSQDLPFLIRIPESIPPSIALERGAGIRYELVATVCTLGKKGFFRRRKTAVISQATTIIIDKHELHSTWPVYSQPESRSVHQDGVHLTVDRGRTCYGPGDRVSIMAILKSDAIHPVVLRGFEFTLKETTIFRAGPHPSSKRSGPQSKVANIGEQKVPLNATLYNGTHHKAELGCLIPNTHTTTTLNAARHIDITYGIVVRAWIGSMQSVMIELPVIVSNWPRNVSEEAIRRIGLAPSLCVTPPSGPAATVPINTSVSRPQTADSYFQNGPNRLSNFDEFGVNPRTPPAPPKQSVQYSTAPSAQNGIVNALFGANEHGVVGDSAAKVAGTIDHPGYGSSNRPSSRGGLGGIQEESVLGSTEGSQGNVRARTTSDRRRRPSANANRLTITNISEKDAEDGITPQVSRSARPMTPPRATQNSAWPSAENEKKTLYENAMMRVQKVQGTAALANATAASDAPSTATPATTTPSKKSGPWPTAELEKVRLYEHAQATAKRTQAYGVSSPSAHSRSSSEAHSPASREKPSVTPGPAISAGVALYQHAVSSISNANPNNIPEPNSQASPPSPPSSIARVPHYPSAEEEKAALKRYHEAKLAVDRNQGTQFTPREDVDAGSSDGHAAPVPYDSLYPEANGSSRAGGSDMPPPFEGSSSASQPQYLNEKERLRRQYEAQDNAALAAQAQAQQAPPHTMDAPSYTGPPPEDSGLSKKEIIRRLDEQEQMALVYQQQQRELQQQELLHQEPEHLGFSQIPPHINGSRAPPTPPTVNGFRPLTAAEEKAQLRAKYAAEEQVSANGYALDDLPPRHPYASATPVRDMTPPPPLMPRPPAEYIQETQEADRRGRHYGDFGADLTNALDRFAPMPSRVTSPQSQLRLDVRPFSPFDAGLGYDTRLAVESPIPVHAHLRSPPPQPPTAPY